MELNNQIIKKESSSNNRGFFFIAFGLQLCKIELSRSVQKKGDLYG